MMHDEYGETEAMEAAESPAYEAKEKKTGKEKRYNKRRSSSGYGSMGGGPTGKMAGKASRMGKGGGPTEKMKDKGVEHFQEPPPKKAEMAWMRSKARSKARYNKRC